MQTQVTVTAKEKSQVDLEISLAPDAMQPYLKKAAATLSREQPLKGFRPGKVPLHVAIERYGAMPVWQEAADGAVRDAYVHAVRDNELHTIGQPKIAVKQLVPDSDLQFTATVSVLPEITLPDLSTIEASQRTASVSDQDIDQSLEELRKLQPVEALVDRAAEEEDKAMVDLDLTRDRVPVEGGQARDHAIYLNEKYYLPAVRDHLLGMTKDEEKTFDITFPDDHFQKHLAGQTASCHMKVKGVYSVELPPIDDAFARRLGQPDAAALRSRVQENLLTEAEKKCSNAEEQEMLQAIINSATISELPELLITSEAHRIMAEIEQSITSRGLAFDDYLAGLKKSREDLMIDMAPRAVERVKVALITNAVAVAHPEICTVEDADVEAQVQKELAHYDDPDLKQRIDSEESRSFIRTTMRNRNVILWIRDQIQWKEHASDATPATTA
jgi:trigger factor